MRKFVAIALLCLPAIVLSQSKVFTAEDYARAEKFLGPNVAPLVVGGSVSVKWLEGDRFWYRTTTPEGTEYVLIDPAKKTRGKYTPTAEDSAGFGRMRFGRRGAATAVSPDGKTEAFIRDWNLWVRDVASGKERALTTDGVKDFGYATDNAGWTSSDRAILLWSPDSKKIVTQQQDERNVGEMYLVETKVGHPKLRAWKYPLPGDSIVAMIHRVIIEVESGKMIRLQMAPDFHRATLNDDLLMTDYKWSPDGSRLVFASTSRDHKQTTVRFADAATGVVRTVFEETVATQYESYSGWDVLWGSNEVLWYSQRDNWGQLYLYDLNTGKLKGKVTSGEGTVSQIVKADEKSQTLWFGAFGKEKGRDPYFQHYYKVGLDGKHMTLLTPEDANHAIQLSPDGKYFVDTYSKPDVPPVVNLRDGNGKL
ncbi:MAG TPA: DPP IV N-terminal domain-containing protein, partial [Bacteroidota bacterium]|nr:DPP IV N-terminal domain-containing protein [Bacteroidota bacterium]